MANILIELTICLYLLMPIAAHAAGAGDGSSDVMRSSDEASVATQSDTLTASVNGTNKIFVTTQFPVVHPRKDRSKHRLGDCGRDVAARVFGRDVMRAVQMTPAQSNTTFKVSPE